MSNSTTVVRFNDANLVTANIDGIKYVAMRPIVEGIGLDWATQLRKLKKSFKKHGCSHMPTPTNSGYQDMLYMPLNKLNGWLFSVNPEKVRPELKDTIIQYQEECFVALHDYWSQRDFVIGQLDEWRKQELISFEKGSEHGKGLCLRKKEKHFIQGNIKRLEDLIQPDLFIDAPLDEAA